jgi:F0F1-type ATP synthase membrane subunit b/b'
MKSLRADLASAARDARQEAKQAGRSTRADTTGIRVESRSQLQQAEVVISMFRHQMRAELRNQVVAGDLAAETVELLRTGLETVRSSVIASLKNARG